MNTLISTSASSLNTYALPEDMAQILSQCVEDIENGNKLLVNPKIKVFGKECTQHRAIGFFSNESIGYKYSGQIARSQELTPELVQLLDYVNTMFSSEFNGILVNKYNNGEDSIGKHSDNERGLDSRSGVIAISYGAVRKFRIRNKQTNEIVMDVPTHSNTIIQMAGDFQKEFTHEIPVEKKVKEARYSFTFRYHVE